jgi:hypothetical protein
VGSAVGKQLKVKSNGRNERHFVMRREKEYRSIVRLPGASTVLRQGPWNFDIYELISHFIV